MRSLHLNPSTSSSRCQVQRKRAHKDWWSRQKLKYQWQRPSVLPQDRQTEVYFCCYGRDNLDPIGRYCPYPSNTQNRCR